MEYGRAGVWLFRHMGFFCLICATVVIKGRRGPMRAWFMLKSALVIVVKAVVCVARHACASLAGCVRFAAAVCLRRALVLRP